MFSSKNQVERKIVRQYWDDGLLDILSGCAILLIGLAWTYDLVALGAIAPTVIVPLWQPLRVRITEPRLGHVEFSDLQTHRYRSYLVWCFFAGCLTLVLGVFLYFFAAKANGVRPLESWVAAIPAWAIGFLAFAASLVVLVRRFAGYAAVFLVLGLVVVLFERRPEFAMLFGGILVTIVGVVRMFAFLRSHPRQPMQMNGV